MRGKNSEKDKLVEVKVVREQKILQMEEEYQDNRKEIAKLQELEKEVGEAENGLSSKKEEYQTAWAKTQT